jgi:addiction module HigA family antidote
MPKHIEPSTPGEILLEDFLKPLGLSQNELARQIGVHPRRVNEIILGRRSITADTALRLARYFGTGPEFWMNLQTDYDLRLARRKLGKSLLNKVKVRNAKAA